MPDTVSPQLQSDLALPHRKPGPPPTPNQAYQLRVGSPEQERRRINGLLDRFNVRSEERRIGGVPCFILTPVDLPASHRHRLLVHVHRDAYIEGAGIRGTDEAIMMAATHSRVVSIDYRMPPDFPFPLLWMTRWRSGTRFSPTMTRAGWRSSALRPGAA